LKRGKNPWEALDDIREFARKGRASVLPEWTSVYFRWWGIYTQGDGGGAVGGQGGEGKATDYFMFRIRIPNGILGSDQLRTNMLAGNPEFYNLPRKFKISITGCPSGAHIPRSTTLA
jgi:sulfite reductase beta subunit-like hemoprotein